MAEGREMAQTRESGKSPRARIIDIAASLLHEHGPAAVTRRGVAEADGVQAPAIYRLFGDKDGLLEAVAEHVMSTFVAEKSDTVDAAAADGIDPLDDLRAGWDKQIAFGLANPSVFRLLSDPGRVRDSVAARSGRQLWPSECTAWRWQDGCASASGAPSTSSRRQGSVPSSSSCPRRQITAIPVWPMPCTRHFCSRFSPMPPGPLGTTS